MSKYRQIGIPHTGGPDSHQIGYVFTGDLKGKTDNKRKEERGRQDKKRGEERGRQYKKRREVQTR